MKCSDLGEEQHVVLREIERGRIGKRYGRTITTVAERLDRKRSEITSLCEELQDLGFVRLPGSGAVEVLVGCTCGLVPRGQAGGQAGVKSSNTSTSTSQVVREQEHLRCSRPLLAGPSPARRAEDGSRQGDLRAAELGLRNTHPGPAPIAWDEPKSGGRRKSRGSKLEPEVAVKRYSEKTLKKQAKRWKPVDHKWTGYDLATYFTYQVVAFYPRREGRIPVEIMARQLREWMKLDDAIDPPLIKAMIDKFVEDPRSVDSNIPAWKSFLNARKRLLRAVEEQEGYEVDGDKVREALDDAAAELLAH